MTNQKVYVVGVGMTKFEKPGRRDDYDYPDMAKEAVNKALSDANILYSDVKQACVGYVFGDSTCGQRCLYEIGMTGIPIYNVHNNGATGASALALAKELIQSGNDCVLALGFEKMERGSLAAKYTDRTIPLDKHLEKMINLSGIDGSPIAAQLFGNAGIEHMRKYGTSPTHFAKIAWKNHKHSVNNPNSQFRDEYSLQQIIDSPKIFGPLTKLQCCPTSDGAAAVILASEEFVLKHGLESHAVEILGMEMATDPSSSLLEGNIKLVGFDMTLMAAKRLFNKVGLTPEDVDVVELHDCFSVNELITYEALGLCPIGQAAAFIDSGNNTYGGKFVVNPSGGLISKGNPLGATGIAQCSELVWQLRGEADKRQVPGAKIGLQHNLGLGGAVVVALYKKGFTPAISRRSAEAASPEGFQAQKYMLILEQAMQEDKDNFIERVRGIYGFKVTNGLGRSEGYWIINANVGKGKVTYNGKEKPDVTFILSDEDVVKLISGKLNPQMALFQGKIKVRGNLGLAMRLTVFQKSTANRIEELRSKL